MTSEGLSLASSEDELTALQDFLESLPTPNKQRCVPTFQQLASYHEMERQAFHSLLQLYKMRIELHKDNANILLALKADFHNLYVQTIVNQTNDRIQLLHLNNLNN